METPELQKRTKSALFWLGMVASVYHSPCNSKRQADDWQQN